MSDPAGWFPAYRRMYEPEHWLAPTKRDPASRRDAWSDLCQMATWQPRETRSSGTLQRGELVCSVRTLARRWWWHRCKVERFLSELKTRTAIETVNETPDGTVYRIVNYDTYAVTENWKRDTERDTKRDSGETAARQEQEVKHSRNGKEPPLSPLRKSNRKCALPEGWEPNDSHRLRAASDHLDVAREAEKFRAYHLAKGTLFVRWDQAFTTWLLNAKDFRKTNGNGVPPDSEAAQWDAEAVRAKEARALARSHADREIQRLNAEAMLK